MTRIIWQYIKDKLINPFLDINLMYFDLGMEYRDKTNDQVTVDAANAIKKTGVGVKCATITPDEARVKEFVSRKCGNRERHHPQHPRRRGFPRADHLQERAAVVPGWTKPIIIGRHAFGDQYRATDFQVSWQGHLVDEIRRRGRQGDRTGRLQVAERRVALAMYNLDDSIADFARASLNQGLAKGYSVYLSTKNTILKTYDGRFKDIFQEIFDNEFKAKFDAKKIT